MVTPLIPMATFTEYGAKKSTAFAKHDTYCDSGPESTTETMVGHMLVEECDAQDGGQAKQERDPRIMRPYVPISRYYYPGGQTARP